MEYNYKELGLKAGLECHQQLDTPKLFSNAPSLLREDPPDSLISRKIRPTPSELGEYDRAALDMFKRNLTYNYECYNDTTSLIETDEEPPTMPNSEAVKTILEVSLLTNAKLIDNMQIMRKTIIDGSNVSGFQRTMLFSLGGKIPLKNKNVTISTTILEEDSARPITKTQNSVNYRLDRLGIPLIELTTEPELFTPEEVKECALKIGELFRITGRVRRGLGTIRQDVNISIAKGARVELKGVQNISLLDECVKREITRQLKLIEIKCELEKRNVKESDFPEVENDSEIKTNYKELNEILKNSKGKLISNSVKNNKKIIGTKLSNFKGILGIEVQPNYRFGKELAGYLKARTGLKGIIHSDEDLSKYEISDTEVSQIRNKLKCSENDAFVLVIVSNLNDGVFALGAVKMRARLALKGVLNETRNALEDANSEYSRALAGAARMYPETDIPSVTLNNNEVNTTKKKLPMWAKERKQYFIEKFNLPEQLAEKMKLSNWARFFKEEVESGADSKTLAVLLLETFQELKRKGILIENISKDMISIAMKELNKGKLKRDNLPILFTKWIKNTNSSIEELLNSSEFETIDSTELEKIVDKVLDKNIELIKQRGPKAANALIGDVIKEAKGKASGKEIAILLNKKVKEKGF